MIRTRRSKRPIYFVCSTIKEGNLISELIEALDKETVNKIFQEKFFCAPINILGPFYKKRIFNYIEPPPDIILSSEMKRAEYQGWLVNATILKKPENCAFLLFDKRIDGQKFARPNGTKIVKIEDLKLI